MVHDKAAKEAFVSNLTGGSVAEVCLVTLVAPSAHLLWSVLQARQAFFAPYTAAACATDVILNCLAILFATTLYSSSPLLLNALFVSPAVFSAFASASPSSHSHARVPPAPHKNPLPQKPFVTAWRGAMMIITCVAILAVDFEVFPRRFAKVENWGTSLMDLGVGSFVFAGGVVSARALLKQQADGKALPLTVRLNASIRHSLPLFALALLRLWSVKGLDYAEHVTEYGVHWNFFVTLGLLPPFTAIFESAIALAHSFASLSIMLGVAYECALNFTGLTAFIVSAPRSNLFSQNREGIFSFFGYLAIFLAGRATGMYVLPRETDNNRARSVRSRIGWRESSMQLARSALGRLLLWMGVWALLYVLSTSYYGLNLRVSRRLANLPYILWVSAFNCGQLALFCAIEMLFFPCIYSSRTQSEEDRRTKDSTSRVLHAFNRNGLVIFLLANLLTGLVNLTISTLRATQLQSMVVLVTYTVVLAGVALALDACDVNLKL